MSLDPALELLLAPISDALEQKRARLYALIAAHPRVIVAFSGGVDSTLLARVAFDVLGDRASAVTARSPSLLSAELDDAVALAAEIRIAHRVIDTHELARPGYTANAPDRCYHCKSELFDTTQLLADAEGAVVLDGLNADDLSDHRPGIRAAAEHRVVHPLAEVGLRKSEVRTLSRLLGLRSWNKPQLACLSSRIPHGMAVTSERLGRIAQVELALRSLGFFDLRARLVQGNEDMVRIELGSSELSRLADGGLRAAISAAAHSAGFRFVTVDLDGFKSGRMNEGLVALGRPPVG